MPNKSLEKGQIVLAPYGSSTTKRTKVRIEEIQGQYAKVVYVEKKIREELGNKPFLIQTKNLKPINIVSTTKVPSVWVPQYMKQFPEFINKNFLHYRVKEVPNAKTNRWEYTTFQKFVRDYLSFSSPYRGVLLYHGLGSGKCMAKGTPILMYDLSIKKIEDIKIGDLLMGDDSTPRTVLSLARGGDIMYKIIPENNTFDSYTVNSEHILCLMDELGLIKEIEVNDYINLPNKENLWGFRSKINIRTEERDLQLQKLFNTYRDGFPNTDENLFLIRSLCYNYEIKDNKIFITDESLYSTPIKVINQGYGEYYGFELNGNGRYLLADCTVTHNTCTSIAVAENLKNEKNVVVLSPASLRSNYVTSLRTDCGVTAYKNDEELLKEKYTFVSYNASNTIDQLKKISSLDNHTIIIDEVHNLISMMVTKSKKGPEIYRMLMEAKNIKIVALSGTPIINYPFEIGLLCNILRGYMDVPVFFVKSLKSSGGLEWQTSVLKEKLGVLNNIEFVDTQQRYVYVYLKIHSYDSEYDETLAEILKTSSKYGVKLDFIETRRYSLYPEDEDDFRQYFIEDTTEGEKLKNTELLKRRMLGIVSYYRGGKPIYYPRLNEVTFVNVPMSDYQYQVYKEVRDVERDKEKAGAMQKLLGKVSGSKSKNGAMKKVTSLFRVFSREFSNFVFPPDIERPFVRKFINDAKKKQLEKKAKRTGKTNLEDIEKENKRTEEENLTRKDKELIEEAFSKLAAKKDEYLKDTPNGLKRYSPKMAKMIEIMNKSPGLILVYSAFRSLEGIGILSLAMEANGWKKYNVDRPNVNKTSPRFAVYSGAEDELTREKLRGVFNSPENKYGADLKALLVTSAGAEGIDLKNIRQVHIMEPYWHDVRISQVIGRANRYLSHIELPNKDREVDIYRYMSVFTDEQKSVDKEKESTDEYIYGVAKKKLVVTEEIKKLMKDIAVDCTLNVVDNEKDIKCFKFGVDASGLAYKADIKEDLVYGKSEMAVKKVKKVLEPMFLDGDNNLIRADKKKKQLCYFNDLECKEPLKKAPETVRKVAVDMSSYEVFDVASAKYGNPVKLGVVDERGKMV